MSHIVAVKPDSFDPLKHSVYFHSSELEPTVFYPLEFLIRKVRINKTKDEKLQGRRAYHRRYIQRPEVAAKIKERQENPEEKKKRQAYGQLPEVKERKRVNNKRKRELIRLTKETSPELFRQLWEKVESEVPQKVTEDASGGTSVLSTTSDVESAADSRPTKKTRKSRKGKSRQGGERPSEICAE